MKIFWYNFAAFLTAVVCGCFNFTEFAFEITHVCHNDELQCEHLDLQLRNDGQVNESKPLE